MRLTVHLTEAKKVKVEQKTKDGIKIVDKVFNTLSFKGVEESSLQSILQTIENDELGKVGKYYFSNDKKFGHASGSKKKA